MSQSTVNVELRKAGLDDLELMLAWRSNPRIYRNFRDQDEPLKWEEHIQWFCTRSPKRRDYIIEYQGRRIGVVAIARSGDVGIYIGEETLWGEGLATDALKLACERISDRSLHAQIHTENEASQHLFEKCGFEHERDEGEYMIYAYQNHDS
jgi:RimJ/RimL family protein N-acetyltransferase